LRIGLSLVAALSSSFSISGTAGGGTEVAITIPLRASAPPSPEEGDSTGAGTGVSISASDSGLLPGVLSRAVSAFALRRDLSVDQIADAILLAESVSESSDAAFDGEQLNFSLIDGDGGIEMTVGPLSSGGGGRLREGLKLPGESGSVEALADSVGVETKSDGEYVAFRIAPGH
jgi:hypothetical protein